MSSELYQLHCYHVNVFYNTYIIITNVLIHLQKGCRVKVLCALHLITLHEPLAINGTSPKNLYIKYAQLAHEYQHAPTD